MAAAGLVGKTRSVPRKQPGVPCPPPACQNGIPDRTAAAKPAKMAEYP